MSSQEAPAQVEPEVNGDDEKERSRIVRLRENKRRSRARQKEYVQQLERRCREYEQAHVQATVEMQVAARKVATDNRMLRLLLRKMGADDHMIESWLEGQMGSEDGRTLNLPIRKRSQSVSTAAGGSQFGEGSPGPPYIGEHTPKPDHHFIETSAPNSPHGRNLPLLLQPLTQPTSPTLQTPTIPSFHEDHGLQPFTYSPVLNFNNIPSPTHSAVASSPQAILESPNLQYYPVHPPSPNAPFTPIPQQHIDPASPLERKPPLVFIRLDPTNDLYKLYPMSTIAIIPWLYSTVPPQHELDIQHHLNNPNVVGIDCEPPKIEHDTFNSYGQSDYNFNFEYSTATSEDGDRSNVEMDSESGSGPSVWT